MHEYKPPFGITEKKPSLTEKISEQVGRITMVVSMVIFGTIGIFRRYIPLPSGVIAFARGLVGTLFLLVFLRIQKQKLDWPSIKRNLVWLAASGAALGVNWMLLFEAYQYTSVATATLCYYMAPIFVILASPVFLKERLTWKKLACVGVAAVGMALVSGVLEVGISFSETKGILFGLGAAVFYAAVILLNRNIGGLSAYDKTIVQLGTSAAVLVPYILLIEHPEHIDLTAVTPVLLLLVGVFHTGVAYALYFGSMDALSAQTVALLGYIDPIVAVILSAVVLRETVSPPEIAGAVLVLGAAITGERLE